jgi:hypothetical protein
MAARVLACCLLALSTAIASGAENLQPLTADFVAVVPANFGQTFSLPIRLGPGQTVRKHVCLSVPTSATSGTRLVNTCLRHTSTGLVIAERTLVVELSGRRTP